MTVAVAAVSDTMITGVTTKGIVFDPTRFTDVSMLTPWSDTDGNGVGTAQVALVPSASPASCAAGESSEVRLDVDIMPAAPTWTGVVAWPACTNP